MTAIDLYFPLEQVKFHESDKPWVTPYIKALVKKRQKAFHSGNAEQWKSLRNKVKVEISKRKLNFYADKTKNLQKKIAKDGGTSLINYLDDVKSHRIFS